jgi:hypothetical protein
MVQGHAPARSRASFSRILVIVAVLIGAARSIAFSGVPVVGQQAPDLVLPGLLDTKTLSLRDEPRPRPTFR